jgi:hypothetical protein
VKLNHGNVNIRNIGQGEAQHKKYKRLKLGGIPSSWKEAKVIALPKPGKDSKFPQNLRPISLLYTTGK